MTSRQWLLLILAAMGLIKGVWGVLRPDSMRSITRWWMGVARNVNTLLAIVAFGVAFAIWVFVLINQDAVSLLLLAYGLFFAWAGTVYLHRDQLNQLAQRLILGRKDLFIRVLSLCVTILCGIIVWVAVR
jgi:hypothetical protein